jgi:DNA polymerase-3 subunit delta
LYKHIDKAGHVVEFSYLSESDLIKYIASSLGRFGKRIDAATARYLIHYSGTELSVIHQEIQKLADYTGEAGIIGNEDIDAVCIKSIESKIFELVDCMGTNRRARALKLYHDLISSKEPPLRILFMLTRQFRMTYKAKLCHTHGLSDSATIGKMKVQPFLVKKCLVQARAFTIRQLEDALNECLQTEDDIKSGLVDASTGIEGLVIKYSG